MENNDQMLCFASGEQVFWLVSSKFVRGALLRPHSILPKGDIVDPAVV